MKQLSTVARGDFFEEQVFNLVSELLKDGKLGLEAKSSKIFWKKPYYSEARKKDIIFDISIETFIGKSEKYSWLTIFECKNYNHAVPVDDIEEFDSKLRQIGEHNTKGFIFSNKGFQEGTLNFAQSKGIGLVKVLSKDRVNWVNYRKDRNNYKFDNHQVRFCLSPISNDEGFFSYFNTRIFESLPDLLIHLGIIEKYTPKQADIFIPFKTPNDLENIIQQFSQDDFYESGKLIDKNLCKFLSKNYGVKFVFDKSLEEVNKNQILGKIVFSPLTIFITKELYADFRRWRFTLAHEIGHLILHSHILKEYIDDNSDIEKSISLDGGVPTGMNKRMEVQANMFASRLLLPYKSFLKDVQKYFEKADVNRGRLYLDHQPCNIILVNNFLNELKNKYDVSNEVSKYRLKELGLIEIESN